MGCQSCKDKNKNLDAFIKGDDKSSNNDIGFIIVNVLIRIIMFAISLAATPIILLFVVWMLFKTIILNKGEVNVMPSMVMIGHNLGIGRNKSKKSDDHEEVDLDKPDDYELDEKVDEIKL